MTLYGADSVLMCGSGPSRGSGSPRVTDDTPVDLEHGHSHLARVVPRKGGRARILGEPARERPVVSSDSREREQTAQLIGHSTCSELSVYFGCGLYPSGDRGKSSHRGGGEVQEKKQRLPQLVANAGHEGSSLAVDQVTACSRRRTKMSEYTPSSRCANLSGACD